MRAAAVRAPAAAVVREREGGAVFKEGGFRCLRKGAAGAADSGGGSASCGKRRARAGRRSAGLRPGRASRSFF